MHLINSSFHLLIHLSPSKIRCHKNCQVFSVISVVFRSLSVLISDKVLALPFAPESWQRLQFRGETCTRKAHIYLDVKMHLLHFVSMRSQDIRTQRADYLETSLLRFSIQLARVNTRVRY